MSNLRTMTAENLEPWNGNIVDVTMLDGTHRVGLLQRVDSEWVRLKASRGFTALPDNGLVRISQTSTISRAARN